MMAAFSLGEGGGRVLGKEGSMTTSLRKGVMRAKACDGRSATCFPKLDKTVQGSLTWFG